MQPGPSRGTHLQPHGRLEHFGTLEAFRKAGTAPLRPLPRTSKKKLALRHCRVQDQVHVQLARVAAPCQKGDAAPVGMGWAPSAGCPTR